MTSAAAAAMSSTATVAAAAAAAATSSAAGSSPCAACKFLRRKCQPDCVFAPYFPPDQPQKFVRVHKVFGASNVTKLLGELTPFQREDAVNSLAYEAEMRLRDPVYGCVGVISLLHHQLRQLQVDLACARSELSRYQALGAAANLGSNLQYPVGIMAAGRSPPPPPEQFLSASPARELHPNQQQHHQYYHQYNNYVMARGACDAEVAARLHGANGGACDAGFMAAMSMSAGLGALGSAAPFTKARAAAAAAAAGEEGQAIGQ